MKERLQKYLAQCGIASRRKSEELIRNGYISINGNIVKDMGIIIDDSEDVVKYNGIIVEKVNEKIYVMLNKPEGYITTMEEQFGRSKVTDLLEGIKYRIYPVGRLDCDSSGLLILTNDGDITFKLTHPGHEVKKAYVAVVEGIPDEIELNKIRNGLDIEDYITSPAEVINTGIWNNTTELKITIHEGKNRQVRKMCSAIGYEVISLSRVSVGDLYIGTLKKGEWRYLSKNEIEYLKNL